MNLIITDFTADHIEAATQLARQNYEEERGFVSALPPDLVIPDLAQFADNTLTRVIEYYGQYLSVRRQSSTGFNVYEYPAKRLNF